MPRAPRLYLGIDGGGTKTAACVLDATGAEVGRGLGGPCNAATGSVESMRSSLAEAVGEARLAAGMPADDGFAAACAGVAGYGSKRGRIEFEKILREIVTARRYRIEPDFVIAYWGASEGKPGVLVSAGTGSVVYARNKQGQTARADGRGWLFGDRGSAFATGRLALMDLVWHYDAGEAPRDFDRRMMSEIGVTDASDAMDWAYREFEPARIAGLGATIACWADGGDAYAKGVLRYSMSMLANTVLRVTDRLDLRLKRTPFYLTGGMWDAGGKTASRLLAQSLAEYYRINHTKRFHRHRRLKLGFRQPLHDPATGAALLAMARAR
jgi:glucosamine kinase